MWCKLRSTLPTDDIVHDRIGCSIEWPIQDLFIKSPSFDSTRLLLLLFGIDQVTQTLIWLVIVMIAQKQVIYNTPITLLGQGNFRQSSVVLSSLYHIPYTQSPNSTNLDFKKLNFCKGKIRLMLVHRKNIFDIRSFGSLAYKQMQFTLN